MTATEKIVKVLDDQLFCETLKGMETEEEVKAAFATKGITENDLNEAKESGDGKELTSAELAGVSGGLAWTSAVFWVGGVVIPSALQCNTHTNWGRNGKKCICGMHFFGK